MKILYIPTYIYNPYGPNWTSQVYHGDGSRDLGMPEGFALCGADVTCVVDYLHCNYLHPMLPIKFITLQDIKISDYDAIILTHISTYNLISKTDILTHPNIGWQMDGPPGGFFAAYGGLALAETVHMTGFLTPYALMDFQAQFPNKTGFISPWGVPLIPLNLKNPYPVSERKKIFFSGGIDEKRLKLLNILASEDDFEVWIAGTFTSDLTKRSWSGGLNDQEKNNLLDPNIYLICCQANKHSTEQDHPHGPMLFGSFWDWVKYADVAINPVTQIQGSTENFNRATYTKICNYLACGTPTITFEGPANAGDITWYNAGQIVPYGDFPKFIQAIRD